MINAAINGAIALVKSNIFEGKDITIIKDYNDGMVAVLNNTGSCVAVMAYDEEDDYFYNTSGWVKVADHEAIKLADSLYG
tara:strand:- start:13548 stop:13787 length:240 start_codon:yes stop_codon:yes gene_type:complete